jgi:uncharacterized protein (TIGR03118 family)
MSLVCRGTIVGLALVLLAQSALGNSMYLQTNLASNLPGVAANQDPKLVNPWGIAFSATSPVWISDNGTGFSTVYNGAGQPFPTGTPLVVTIQPAPGGTPPGTPTGVVFNGTSSFGGSQFIFASEDGLISAWSNGTTALRMVDNSPSGAVYKGLAIAGTTLYAADFRGGKIDAFDGNFKSITLPGGFTDPNLPSGFAPFNIQNIGGKLYVTYAKQDASGKDELSGAGNGYVDVFDTNGNLLKRLISGGPLNSPWGLTLAPGDFGAFSNDLLIGNFGDGKINAFDPVSGNALGVLQDSLGDPIVNLGLWGLAFGNGSQGTQTNTLYFTAGIPDPGKDNIEANGLFGELQSFGGIQGVPEPNTLWPTAFLCAALLVGVRLRRNRSHV